jgi:hypothetical protein
MAKLEDGLKILSLQTRLAQAERMLSETMAMMLSIEANCCQLAEAIVTTTEFSDWLMDQDVSSAHVRKPGPKVKPTEVEEQDDVTLALAWAAQVYGADGLRRLK